ncbi:MULTISPECIES: DUF4253 domain-containing protein [Streptomyces]|uniref:DUF4253 domain-containing protein n=1 Tax=Streptomyces lycopersici TaxID=2974589 RepID=UPI0021CF7EC3|nr:DUF4253 domain-containing protein [Streptomyces sp. NEAU-383]
MTLTVDQLPDGLPPGRLVVPDTRFAGPGVTEPALWVSDEPLPEAEAGRRWGELFRRHRETGLWPLLLGALADSGSAPLRPWHNGELLPMPPAALDEVDLEGRCITEWEDMSEGLGPESMPYPAWPGMAPTAEPDGDPDERAVALTGSAEGVRTLLAGGGRGPYLGLVGASDGVTAITACGWQPEVGGATVAAMVRSWERRFGVRLCSLGFATVGLTVAWPPRTPDHARHVAAEHIAFCPDLLQIHDDFDTYAAALLDAPVWTLWWD